MRLLNAYEEEQNRDALRTHAQVRIYCFPVPFVATMSKRSLSDNSIPDHSRDNSKRACHRRDTSATSWHLDTAGQHTRESYASRVGRGYARPHFKQDWYPWHADERFNPIPPHMRQGCFTSSKWEAPSASWKADGMQRALGEYLRDQHDKITYVLGQIQQRRDWGEPEPKGLYSINCPGELPHWTPWKAGEEWTPIPPSWRLWPINDEKKVEVATILHAVHCELRQAKQRLREMKDAEWEESCRENDMDPYPSDSN